MTIHSFHSLFNKLLKTRHGIENRVLNLIRNSIENIYIPVGIAPCCRICNWLTHKKGYPRAAFFNMS